MSKVEAVPLETVKETWEGEDAVALVEIEENISLTRVVKIPASHTATGTMYLVARYMRHPDNPDKWRPEPSIDAEGDVTDVLNHFLQPPISEEMQKILHNVLTTGYALTKVEQDDRPRGIAEEDEVRGQILSLDADRLIKAVVKALKQEGD